MGSVRFDVPFCFFLSQNACATNLELTARKASAMQLPDNAHVCRTCPGLNAINAHLVSTTWQAVKDAKNVIVIKMDLSKALATRYVLLERMFIFGSPCKPSCTQYRFNDATQ